MLNMFLCRLSSNGINKVLDMCLFLYVSGDDDAPLERDAGLHGASDRCYKVSMCSSFCVLIHNNGSLKINSRFPP